MNRIICIGNRYHSDDSAGPRVYDRLKKSDSPSDVDVVDGGIGGLNLLPLLEGMERVVFVDNVAGFSDPGRVVLLTAGDLSDLAPRSYGHEAGLPYLVRILPEVMEGPMPDVFVLGIESETESIDIEEIAAMAVRTALHGRKAFSGMED